MYCTYSLCHMYSVHFAMYHNFMYILMYNKYHLIAYCDDNTNQRIKSIHFEGPSIFPIFMFTFRLIYQNVTHQSIHYLYIYILFRRFWLKTRNKHIFKIIILFYSYYSLFIDILIRIYYPNGQHIYPTCCICILCNLVYTLLY